MPNTTQATHPLFRNDSFYRRETNEWLWYDNGETAIRRFFEALRRRQLLSQDLTAEGRDWGFNDETNHTIDTYLASKTVTHPVRLETKDQNATKGSGYLRQAAAGQFVGYRFNVESPDELEKQEADLRSLFGEPGTSDMQETFAPSIANVPAGRECLLLLLSQSLLHRLKMYVEIPARDYPRMGDPQAIGWMRERAAATSDVVPDPAEILPRVLDEMQEPADNEEKHAPQLRKAFWLSTTLADAVGVRSVSGRIPGGHSDDSPRFHTNFTLTHPAPTLGSIEDDPIIPLLCIGPQVAEKGE